MNRSSPDNTLSNARIVIACGGGVQDREIFQLICDLAEIVGAAVAGTRPAMDRGFIQPDQMIGSTGRSIQPEIYLAVGISGASQHQTGIGESARIIAINSDPSAPIFSTADVGIVGDLHQILPRMIRAGRNGMDIDQIIHQVSTEGDQHG